MSYQFEIRSSIAKRITNSLKEDKIPWRYGKCGIPTNAITGAKYTGINPIILNSVAEKYDFNSRYWGTKKQWQQADAKVLKQPASIAKEDHGVNIINWQENTKEIDYGTVETFLTLRTFEVFNAKQVAALGIDCCFENDSDEEVDHEFADEVIKQSRASILHVEGSKTPYFDRELDKIILPDRSYFLNDSQYYATVFHELAHYAESRTNYYGPSDQSELVAEIVTETLETVGRLPHDPDLTNHNKYIQEWLHKIEQNPKYLFDAAAAASRSIDWILQNVRHLMKTEKPISQKMFRRSYFG